LLEVLVQVAHVRLILVLQNRWSRDLLFFLLTLFGLGFLLVFGFYSRFRLFMLLRDHWFQLLLGSRSVGDCLLVQFGVPRLVGNVGVLRLLRLHHFQLQKLIFQVLDLLGLVVEASTVDPVHF